MRRLFITADELGITSQRTHSIFQLTEHGTVTGTSIIPNFPHSDIAARHAKERDLSAGLHINLTDGFPLSEERDISSLLQTDGVFLGMEGLERGIAESEIDRTHIERELRSQFEWMLDTYGQPTHVSGYHHIHVHPFVSKILVPLLDQGLSKIDQRGQLHGIPRSPSVPGDAGRT